MEREALDRAVREAGGRVIAALAARYRDLDLAEESYAEACLRAVRDWPHSGAPADPAAWLYRVASRAAIDALRKRAVRNRLAFEAVAPNSEAEEAMNEDNAFIPDDRLRLIFICCHPTIAADARAALTLRLVCGLATGEIAHAFLLPEPTLAQRLVRAKRKIAEAKIAFELPEPQAWPERVESVLSTIEIAYSKAHEDAGGAGRHPGFAAEMLRLSLLLARLMPEQAEVLGLAATIHFAEARRPARLDDDGAMVPLSEQDPKLWRAELSEAGRGLLVQARALGRSGPRLLQAEIHGAWCDRASRSDPPPWPRVLRLYDALLAHRDDPVIRLNRAVALAETVSPAAALAEIEALDFDRFQHFLPYHAARADLLARTGRDAEAAEAYDRALALGPAPAERAWLAGRRRQFSA